MLLLTSATLLVCGGLPCSLQGCCESSGGTAAQLCLEKLILNVPDRKAKGSGQRQSSSLSREISTGATNLHNNHKLPQPQTTWALTQTMLTTEASAARSRSRSQPSHNVPSPPLRRYRLYEVRRAYRASQSSAASASAQIPNHIRCASNRPPCPWHPGLLAVAVAAAAQRSGRSQFQGLRLAVCCLVVVAGRAVRARHLLLQNRRRANVSTRI